MLAGLKPVCPQGNLSRGQRVATAQEVWNSAIQGVRNRGRASVSEVDSGGFPEKTPGAPKAPGRYVPGAFGSGADPLAKGVYTPFAAFSPATLP